MKMLRLALVSLFVIALTVGSAAASKQEGDYVYPTVAPGFCPLGLYKAVKRNANLAIPDNNPAGVCLPPIEFADVPDQIITDVIVDLNIEHSWIGDLIITLCHTSDAGVVKCVDLVNRPGVPQSTFGCSGDLVSDPEAKYYFSSRPDLEPLGETDCPSDLPAGCYHTSVEAGPGAMGIFTGIPLGDGVWQVCINDNAGGDTGFVYNWSVHVLAEAPVSIEQESWGNVKASYR